MVTRSIVGRFLILAVFIVAVGVVAQAALILTEGKGKNTVKTASAAPVSSVKAPDQSDVAAADPVRVVYPGPLGDTTAQKPKLADAASASPLDSPAPQTTAKLAQAMAGTAAAVSPQPATPAPAPVPQPAVVPPAATPIADQPADPVAQPAPSQAATAPQAPPATAAPAGVQVASLGGGAPAANPASAGGLNINTASVEALNRLGGGHIGESIAKHRPYRSVEELVKKRVLRRSVFDQIRNQIAAR